MISLVDILPINLGATMTYAMFPMLFSFRPYAISPVFYLSYLMLHTVYSVTECTVCLAYTVTVCTLHK